MPPLKEPSRPPSTSASTSCWWGVGARSSRSSAASSYRGSRIGIVDAEEVVGFDEPSTTALRKKPRASVRVAAELVRDGAAEGFFTAGHTGAAMVTARAALGVVDGIDRPALARGPPGPRPAAAPPRRRGERLLPRGELPRVRPDGALLRAGGPRHRPAEDRPPLRRGGGGEGDRDDARGLRPAPKKSGLNFVGNCEGRDVYGGNVDVDVVVTDGFTGNVVLKVSESLAKLVEEALKQEITRSLQASMGFLLSRDAFRSFKKRLDYTEYGGAPLLGVKGAVLIGHGSSNETRREERDQGAPRVRQAQNPREDPRESPRAGASGTRPLRRGEGRCSTPPSPARAGPYPRSS